MVHRIRRTSPGCQPEPADPPVLIVAYSREKDRYFLQEQDSGKRVAGPFKTSLIALEYARSQIR